MDDDFCFLHPKIQYLCGTKQGLFLKHCQTMKKNDQELLAIDFDARWKELIHVFTEEFIAFFLPSLYPLVNFSKPPEFLEQELAKLAADTERSGKKITDKLIKLYLKNGEEQFVLVHIEVEGDAPSAYSKEIFKYYYRALDQHEVDIATIVVYVGDKVPRQHNVYTRHFHGTELTFKFNSYLVKQQSEVALMASDNIFALAILANLYVLQSKNQYDKRMAFKTHLIALLRKKNYKQETIRHLLVFIWYLVLLPKDQNQQLLFNLSKTTDMPLVTEGEIMFMNELALFKYGKSIDQMLEEIKNAVAKEEQLLAQQKAEKEQLLAQQKVKEEHTIVNMYQKLALDVATIANILNVSTDFVQEVLSKNNLG